MAASRLPQPGSEFGPCLTECKHIDCKQTREMSESICEYCNEPILYETRFYDIRQPGEPMKLVHANCHEVAVEKEQAESAAS